MSNAEQYDLRSPQSPRLAGRALHLSVRLLEAGITRGVLIRRLLRQAGVAKLRELPVDEEPTFRPFAPGPARRPRPDPPAMPDLGAVLPAERSEPGGFAYATVRDYAEAYRCGAAAPEEVASAVIDAIAASDAMEPPLRAFIACDRDDVIAQARASARRFGEGKPLSLFDGVPVAVKDELDVAGYGTTVGTRFLGRIPARADATAVARMRAAGAVLIGKTNMHEIGIGVTGMNPHHGTPRNPHNPAHHTGGSSSGSSAAVAGGLCPVAIGADGGGSIRIPAALCGVVGLKPTYTRVSEFGAVPLDWSVAHIGPIAATASDAALAYALMAGPDPKDPATLRQPPVSLDGLDSTDVGGITLGIYRPWFEDADPSVVEQCETLVKGLVRLGARVRDTVIPDLDAVRMAHLITISSEMAAAMRPYYKEHRKDFSLEVRADLALARSLSAGDYIQAQRVRTRAIAHFQRAFEQVDCILTPMTGCSAPSVPTNALRDGVVDLEGDSKLMRFAFPANLTGLPAISFPAGWDPAGLPVGLQAIGQYWQEHVLLRIAQAAAKLVERRTPRAFFEVLPR